MKQNIMDIVTFKIRTTQETFNMKNIRIILIIFSNNFQQRKYERSY